MSNFCFLNPLCRESFRSRCYKLSFPFPPSPTSTFSNYLVLLGDIWVVLKTFLFLLNGPPFSRHSVIPFFTFVLHVRPFCLLFPSSFFFDPRRPPLLQFRRISPFLWCTPCAIPFVFSCAPIQQVHIFSVGLSFLERRPRLLCPRMFQVRIFLLLQVSKSQLPLRSPVFVSHRNSSFKLGYGLLLLDGLLSLTSLFYVNGPVLRSSRYHRP